MAELKVARERSAELLECLVDVRSRIKQAAPDRQPVLVAVSKYKLPEDILACFEHGQRDFGENFVQELVHKSQQLPAEIRWHFIGTLQSNKAKMLAAIPNLYAVHTITSPKTATLLDSGLPQERTIPLNILLQVNTSGEDAKSGLAPLSPEDTDADSPLLELARHIVKRCPRLRLQGLMTIGSLAESVRAEENRDFERLKVTRDLVQASLAREVEGDKWGEGGRLLLSMGMSSDFEVALRAGSDLVRVGAGIFGTRPSKLEQKA